MAVVLVVFTSFLSISVLAGSASYAQNAPRNCAEKCSVTGYNSDAWSLFSPSDYFQRCTWYPTLFTYGFDSSVPPTSSSLIRACVDDEEETRSQNENKTLELSLPLVRRFCRAEQPRSRWETQLSRRESTHPHRVIPGQVLGAASIVQSYLGRGASPTTTVTPGTVLYSVYGDAVVGTFVGAGFEISEVASGAFQDFIEEIENTGIGQTLQMQYCGKNGTASSSFGIIADTSSGTNAFSVVRRSVEAWSSGSCANIVPKAMPVKSVSTTRNPLNTGFKMNTVSQNDNHRIFDGAVAAHNKANFTTNIRYAELLQNSQIALVQSECNVIEVMSGDTCGKLASRCQTPGPEFERFNKQDLCSTLVPGQQVCCSPGSLPSLRQAKQHNGDCAVYTVQPNDGCQKIAMKHGLTVDELEKLNEDTWGYNGCASGKIFPNDKLCVSEGEPPFPSADRNAACGPTKPGTAKPKGMGSRQWGILNPCPLKACCNNWGQCGTTEDFCIDQSTGRPGTSKTQNGCVGNCGMAIANRKPPQQFLNVGYFEAWNQNRKCLHMDVTDIPAGKYTHVHYGFADITSDYQVDIGKFQDQWDKFKNAKGYKRIVAFGGWDFSTLPQTHNIFRAGTRGNTRQILATNIAKFVTENGLDGVDFDWEYPSVPDMNWLPPSSLDEGSNYVEFLKLVRSKLPSKSMSIAAPASFWYMKGIPIADVSKVVDYIVFMTYDLHGQWDYGNKWSMKNCDGGNCLRSHVDLLETNNMLSMITKAGVSTDKIIVGISSYGRQFKMTNPNCQHANCTFTGPESGGTKGRCTDTPDYISNAEIGEIIQKDTSARVKDNGDSSHILFYNGNYVSYMNDKDKAARTSLWKSLSMGGVVDWAISLNSFEHDVKSSKGTRPGQFGVSKGAGGPRRGGSGVGGAFAEKMEFSKTCHEDLSWKQIDCSTKGIAEKKMPTDEAWRDVKADAVWCSALIDWSMNGGTRTTLSFTDHLSDYLNGPPQFKCEEMNTRNGCRAPNSCKGPSEKSAAGMQLVMQSLANINTLFINIYDALTAVQASSTSPLNIYKKTFLPKPDKTIEILLNILQLATGFGSAAFFNGFIKVAPKTKLAGAEGEANKIKADNLKDYTRDTLSTGFDIAKSFNKDFASKKLPTMESKIDYIFSQTTELWKKSITAVNKAIFQGDARSQEILSRLMRDGNSVARAAGDMTEYETSIKKFIYSVMTPEVWRMQNYYPVLLDTAFGCDIPGIGVRQWTERKNVRDNIVCNGGRQFQIWAVKGTFGCKGSGPCGIQRNCNSYLQDLPGVKDIRKPISDWGDMSLFTMANSAFDGYYNLWHGNHRYSDADLEDDNTIVAVADSVQGNPPDLARLPGAVSIPICTWAEIKANWIKGPDASNPSYPCNNSGSR